MQILPAYTPLVEEAVLAAVELPFEDVRVPVVDTMYLCAIALQTGRAKDYQRVDALLQAESVDRAKLENLIAQHALQERWQRYKDRYG